MKDNKTYIYFLLLLMITFFIIWLVTTAQASIASSLLEEGSLAQSQSIDASEVEQIQQTEDWQTFRKEEYGFEIRYPKNLSHQKSIDRGSVNKAIGKSSGAPVWRFSLRDQELYRGTNLEDASLIISIQPSEKGVEQCSQMKMGSKYLYSKSEGEELPTVNINGVGFYEDVIEEGGMGNFYKRFVYRTIEHQACYEVTLLIHSSNIDNYAPDSVSPYPEQKTLDQLRDILATFIILDNEPTFPTQEDHLTLQTKDTQLDLANGYADGIDVSHWQGDINWNKVAGAGYSFAFAKATEGVGFKDWNFVDNIENGTSAGVLMGAYHFARPDLKNTGQEEAEYFLIEVGDYIESGYLRPILDLEVSGNLSREALSDWVVEWMETVKNQTGVEPLLYTNYFYIDKKLDKSVTGYDLWMAYWNCDPTPTVNIPPIGDFANWDFWQYSAPSACDDNHVPGIQGGVDKDIFNGLEADLPAYESDAPLWVSLSNYKHQAPAPHYADLSVDVNGSLEGPASVFIWWDCDVLGTDINQIMKTCGALPPLSYGDCIQNQFGETCHLVDGDNYIAEHTYHSIGNFVAKTVVKKEDAFAAEDRYSITTTNPIVSLTPDPTPIGYGIVDQPLQIKVDVKMNTSVEGAVQASIIDDSSQEVEDQGCKLVGHDVRTTKSFIFTLNASEVIQKQYSIWARYRPRGDCPIEDTSGDDKSINYTIYWGFPEIDVQRPLGTSKINGEIDDVGEKIIEVPIDLTYVIDNTKGSTLLKVSDVSSSNFVNVSNYVQQTSMPIEILPGEQQALDIRFEVDQVGAFGFDLALSHNDQDQTPYIVSIQGKAPLPIEDVPYDHWAYHPIWALFNAGITDGCDGGALKYCPGDVVTRAQMAVFLERGIHGSDYKPPIATGIFDDVPLDYWAASWVEQLYADGITGGCGGNNFCPSSPITRAEMASLLLRSKHGSTYTPPAATGQFNDVPVDHWAADWIEQLAAEGITYGCGGGNYCPGDNVTRDQMAVFLTRTFNLPLP